MGVGGGGGPNGEALSKAGGDRGERLDGREFLGDMSGRERGSLGGREGRPHRRGRGGTAAAQWWEEVGLRGRKFQGSPWKLQVANPLAQS